MPSRKSHIVQYFQLATFDHRAAVADSILNLALLELGKGEKIGSGISDRIFCIMEKRAGLLL